MNWFFGGGGGGDSEPQQEQHHSGGGGRKVTSNKLDDDGDGLASIDPVQRAKSLSQQLLMLTARIEGATSLEQRREAAQELAASVSAKPAWMSESITAAFSINHIATLRNALRDCLQSQQEHNNHHHHYQQEGGEEGGTKQQQQEGAGPEESDEAVEYDIVASILDILLAATALPNGSTAWTEIAQGIIDTSEKKSGGTGGGGGRTNMFATGAAGGGKKKDPLRRNSSEQRRHSVELISVLNDETPALLGLLTSLSSSSSSSSGSRSNSSSANNNNNSSSFGSSSSAFPRQRKTRVPFWVQYNAIQLLTRLHAADNTTFSRYLLQCSGVPTLLEILTDSTNNGALRDECLVLLNDVTLLPSNHELQTILAFENCFDLLFTVIREEGGMISGSVVVRECITVMHHIVRQNNAAQRLFREMGNMAQIAALLNTDVFIGASPVKGAPRDTFAQASAATMPPAAAETYATVGSLVSALLRSADSNGEGTDIRNACVAAKLPHALIRAALESLPVASASVSSSSGSHSSSGSSGGGSSSSSSGAGGGYEEEEDQLLATLALVLQGSKPAVEAVASAKVRQCAGGTLLVDVMWLLVRMALSDSDERCGVAAKILATCLSVSGDTVARKLLSGLEKPRSSGSPPMSSGYVLAALTMASKPPTPTTWFVAGHLLASCILADPAAGLEAAKVPWPSSSSSTSSSSLTAMSQQQQQQQQQKPGNSNQEESGGGINFFQAYVARTKRMIEARQNDIATNIASLYPILAWLRAGGSETCQMFAQRDPAIPMFFADWAVAGRDGQHAPLMCAAIVSITALMFPPPDPTSSSSSSSSSSSITRDQLSELVTKHVTLKRIQTLRDGVFASDDWTRLSARGSVLSSLPSNVLVYDSRLCSLITEVVNAVLAPTESAPTTTAPIPSSNHEQQQQQQQQQQHQVPEQAQENKHNTQQQSHQQQQQPATTSKASSRSVTPQDPFALESGNRTPNTNLTGKEEQGQEMMVEEEDPFATQPILAPPTTSTSTAATSSASTGFEPQQEQHQPHHHHEPEHQQHQNDQQQQQQQIEQATTTAAPQQSHHPQQNHHQKSVEPVIQTIVDPQLVEKLETAESEIEQLRKQLAESNAEKKKLQQKLNRVSESSKEEIKLLEESREELKHQFDQAYSLLHTRNEAVDNAERRANLAELALSDMKRDRDELMLLVAEMESAMEEQQQQQNPNFEGENNESYYHQHHHHEQDLTGHEDVLGEQKEEVEEKHQQQQQEHENPEQDDEGENSRFKYQIESSLLQGQQQQNHQQQPEQQYHQQQPEQYFNNNNNNNDDNDDDANNSNEQQQGDDPFAPQSDSNNNNNNDIFNSNPNNAIDPFGVPNDEEEESIM